MKQPSAVTVEITDLSHDGRGIAHVDGKTTFISGALAQEQVTFQYTRRHAKFDEGEVTTVLQSSTLRVEPSCRHYSICGGCSLQHLHSDEQLKIKQKILLEQLQHFGQVAPEHILPPITGPLWGYRRKARLSVKYVLKKGRLLMGFHEKNGRYVADLQHCEVLHPAIPFAALHACLAGLQACQDIPQIEIAVSDNTAALVIRHVQPLQVEDRAALLAFADAHHLQIYLQPAGLDSIHPLQADRATPLSYRLPEHHVELIFQLGDFIQVNGEINRLMVNRAIEWLGLQPEDKVLDLFCGLGNFTLPIARYCNHIVGVEGSQAMVNRAQANALHNNITNAEFYSADLDKPLTGNWSQQHYDKLLLDPARNGAYALVQQMQLFNPQRIVYISCNPATLARDAGVLVHKQGYRLIEVGIIDMFPHTKHVEAMAVFDKSPKKMFSN